MRSLTQIHWIAPALIAGITLAAYHNTFSAPFIFDDTSSITYNPSIRSLWPLGPVLSPPSECTVAGRPFANLTFALNYALGGFAVAGYHAVNLAFHVGAALLLYGATRRTLLQVSARSAADGALARSFAADASLLALGVAVAWAVHPVLTNAVTYISQRTEVLMGFFYLGSLYAFIRGAQNASPYWLTLSVAACFLGTASKEVAVTAPVLMLLYDRAFVAGSFAEAWRKRWRYYLSLMASWLLLATLMARLEDRAVGFGIGVTWWTYALTECQAILHYMRLVLWPSPLVFDYGVSFLDGLGKAWPYVAGLTLVTAATIMALVRWPRAGFLGAAFLLILSPTSSVVPVATQPIAENRLYLPSAALIVLVSLGVYQLFAKKTWSLMVLGAAALVCLTVARNQQYRDRVALWSDTASKRPGNFRAQASLGEMLHETGRLQDAKKQFEAALQLKPDYYEAHNNLGTTLYGLGDVLGAKRHFEEALRLKPDYPAAHNNLGNVLFQTGEVDKAGRHCEEALRLYSDPNRLKPDLAETHNNLGNVRLYQGNAPAAQLHYHAATQLKPDFLQARMNLGVALRLNGQLDDARAQLERVLQAKANFPEAQYNLGIVLAQMGRNDEALRRFAAAIELRDDFAEPRLGLAELLWQKGDLEGAKKQLERVVQLRPSDAAARSGLEQVVALLQGKAGSTPPPP